MSDLSLPAQLVMARFYEDEVKNAVDEAKREFAMSQQGMQQALVEAQKLKTAVQAQLLAAMGAGDRAGANVDGELLGSFSYNKGQASLYVKDADAFRAWVEENAPEKIVRQVEADYAKRVLNEAAASGELPPGVDIHVGDPYLSFRSAAGGKEAAARLWEQRGAELLQPEGGA
ncbi:hypothetical protein VSH64_25030 [Amycolatopsis rhabdoformis]|uniref:Phage protein n=1 Tax=Amycolatopsis rhabdoformis TaxID=1448059 RepID=A0ABZ1HUW4_9PSEU|nr:hypothetical protein [Amycolatopsis rhabdoformis]WSE26142.1 hypothetical protein VSH64_25030 [Amycolatopsis rhabdoformis]